jgi:uncharacterized RDD family membrane protein YckC
MGYGDILKLPGDRDLVAGRSNNALSGEPQLRGVEGNVPPLQQPAPSWTDDSLLHYAGFWPRLGALLLDDGVYHFFIWPVLRALVFWVNLGSSLFPVYLAILGMPFGVFYSVYLVRRFGGTLGKLAIGLRIRKPDGKPVGYREALLRFCPCLLLCALLAVVASLRLAVPVARAAYEPILILYVVWLLADLIVLLGDPKRRALHDYIAGTVVIYDSLK